MPPSTRAASATSLPLLGRDAELQTLRDLLDEAPVVTVVGPGGIGKTSLARALCTSAEDRLVELASVDSRPALIEALADSVGLDLSGAPDPVAALAYARESLEGLWVLDNVEQILGEAADVVGRLVQAGAGGILVTSRVALGLRVEAVLEVPDLPPDAGRALWDRVAPLAHADAGVEELLEMLEGNALSIEIAASRSAVAPPSSLSARIRAGRGLTAPELDRPDRHRSTDAVVRWSWELLDDPLRHLLRRLALFDDVFSLADVESIAEAELGEDLIEGLDQLRRHHLLRADHRGLRLYELVRAFVRSEGIDEELRRRHVRWAVSELRAATERAGSIPPRIVRLTRLLARWVRRVDLETCRQVVEPEEVIDLTQRFLPELEAGPLFEALLDPWGGERGLAWRLLYRQACALKGERRLAEALACMHRAEELAEDRIDALRLRMYRARLLISSFDDAHSELAEATARELDELGGMRAMQWRILACSRRVRGSAEEALEAALRTREAARAEGDLQEEASSFVEESLSAAAAGDSDLALALMDQAVRLADQVRGAGQAYRVRVAMNRAVLVASCRPGEVVSTGEALVERARQAGTLHDEAVGACLILCGEVLEGRSMDPEGRARAERLFTLCDSKWFQVQLWTASVVDAARGDVARAAALAEVIARNSATAREIMQLAAAPLYAVLGEAERAREALEIGRAEPYPSGVAPIEAFVEALAAGRPAPPTPDASSLRLWAALLVTMLDELEGPIRAFEVARDGTFVSAHGEVEDLRRRGPTRRVLRALARAEGPLDADTLIEAGWPGENLIRESAQQRLWQVIRQLRRLGLGDELQRSDDGYTLSEAVRVVDSGAFLDD